MKPAIIINFKAYKQGMGRNAVKLAKTCQKIARQTKSNIAIAVQASDIHPVAKAVNIPVLAQHIDPIEPGAHTGHTLPEAVKQAGAKGTLINHSEKKLSLAEIKKTLKRAKQLKLATIICAPTPARAKALAKLKPDMIAIEPPALIGGKNSVSKAKPELITKTTRAIKKIPVLCGAGIHTKQDVSKARELGAKGILVASGVVKAKNPEKALKELVKGLVRKVISS